MADQLNLEKYAFQPGDPIPAARPQERLPRPKPAGRFLKGPVCWDWLAAAARLPGRALHVALVVQFLAGFSKTRTVALSSDELRRSGVSRTTAYRALKALEARKLVAVDRNRGKLPIITIIPITPQAKSS
jgi:hypothetical protein